MRNNHKVDLIKNILAFIGVLSTAFAALWVWWHVFKLNTSTINIILEIQNTRFFSDAQTNILVAAYLLIIFVMWIMQGWVLPDIISRYLKKVDQQKQWTHVLLVFGIWIAGLLIPVIFILLLATLWIKIFQIY